MAFRLEQRGSMHKQLRRIVRSELRKACRALDNDDVLEARKNVKKTRAVLRLLRKPLASDYADDNRRLRAVARALSSLRDVDATLDTLRTLHARYPQAVSPGVVRAVSRGLSGRTRRAKARTEPIVRRAKHALVICRESVPVHVDRAGDFRAARAGAVDGYRRARAAYRGLALDAESAAFHEWRKRIKDHWYHIRLFAPLPNGPRSRAETLRRLESWLGCDHDLATLRSIVLDADDRFGDARIRTLILGSIVRQETSLRRRALALGARVFAPSPKAFETSVTQWWQRR